MRLDPIQYLLPLEAFGDKSATVLANLEGRKIEIVAVMIKMKTPTGQLVDRDVVGDLTHSIFCDIREYVKSQNLHKTRDHIEIWDGGPDVA